MNRMTGGSSLLGTLDSVAPSFLRTQPSRALEDGAQALVFLGYFLERSQLPVRFIQTPSKASSVCDGD